MKRVLIFTILNLGILNNAVADLYVTCKTVAKKPLPAVEYFARNALSTRLNSDVTYFSNGSGKVYPVAEVAQYGMAKEAIYFLIDNASEIPVLRLYATATKKGYSGNVSEYSAAGKIVKNIPVDCTVAVQ